MGWKRLIMGEKMPDKNDPQYRERYEKEVSAGKKTAKFLRIDKAANRLQRFACRYPKTFLLIAFGIVTGCFMLNVCRMVTYYNHKGDAEKVTVAEHQEAVLNEKLHGSNPNENNKHEEYEELN